MKLINKLICHSRGHKSLQRGQGYTSIYQEVRGRGAFGRGFPYTYEGRLYRCSRCGELCICRGIMSWEIEDLISDTLKDLPKYNFGIDWAIGTDYPIVRLYRDVT